MGHEIVRIAKENKDESLKVRAAGELVEILKKYPVLQNLTMKVLESQEFMRLYQTLDDFDKQMISIYLGLTDNL